MKLLANSQGKIIVNASGIAYVAPASNPTASPLDVNFYDYDGSCRYAYSAAEFAQLTEMPANPSHPGLVAQGWNWTLADAKAAVALSGFLSIGQNYTTDDGASYVNIYIPKGDTTSVTLNIYLSWPEALTIDFGDGSSPVTPTSNGDITVSHTFPSDDAYYTIRFECWDIDSILYQFGHGWPGAQFLGDQNYYVRSMRWGNHMTDIGWQGFQDAWNLETISVPQAVKYAGSYAFNHAHALKCFVVPSPYATVMAYVWNQCYALSVICLPYGINLLYDGAFNETNIDSIALFQVAYGVSSPALRRLYLNSSFTSTTANFYGCKSLLEVTIPTSVTEIGALTFSECQSLSKVHLKSSTPPTLSNTNAFYNVPNTCVFYVPTGSLTAYQTATNWSSFASQMQEE